MVLLLFFENLNQKFHLIGNDEIDKSQLYAFLKQTSETVFPYFEDLKEKQKLRQQQQVRHSLPGVEGRLQTRSMQNSTSYALMIPKER